MKAPIFSNRVLKRFGKIATWTLAGISTAAIFIDIPEKCKGTIFLALLILHAIIYLLTWLSCNNQKKTTIKVGKTKIVIKEGDIFKESGKKVIAFNEYFDTQVDDIIIAKGSLNGIFINTQITDIDALDEHISIFLSKKAPAFSDTQRDGKKNRYELGTIVPYEDYLLLAYSRFDENNRAYLNKEDIASLYLKMWSEIDVLKACSSISMPVLGSSNLVRGISYSPQQLLELLLWSFRISGVNLTRLSALTIVVHRSMIEDIDFIKLNDYSD